MAKRKKEDAKKPSLIPTLMPDQSKTTKKVVRNGSPLVQTETTDEVSDSLSEEDSEELGPEQIEGDSHYAQDPQGSLPIVYDPLDLETLENTEKTISIADPLKKYLHEIKNTPQLSTEEEIILAKRMHEKGDIMAAKALVSANLKLVVRIAYEYRSMYHNLLDLIQEGNMGLIKAVSKFDPTKGARVGYYATWWIRSYILKYLLDNFRLVKVGTSQAQKKLFYHLLREKQRLESQGISPAPALIAHNLQVKEKDVIEMEQRLLGPGAEVSLDAPMNTDDPKSTLMNHLLDLKENADIQLERQEWLDILAETLPLLKKELNPKELAILETRILGDEPKTLQEVADEFGLTRERVRQLEVRVVEKLKNKLSKYLV